MDGRSEGDDREAHSNVSNRLGMPLSNSHVREAEEVSC